MKTMLKLVPIFISLFSPLSLANQRWALKGSIRSIEHPEETVIVVYDQVEKKSYFLRHNSKLGDTQFRIIVQHGQIYAVKGSQHQSLDTLDSGFIVGKDARREEDSVAYAEYVEEAPPLAYLSHKELEEFPSDEHRFLQEEDSQEPSEDEAL